MDDDQQFCLRWNNHQSTLVAVFDTLLEKGMHVDCTLAAEGQTLKAHKVVLSACSPYFESVLSQQFDKHPIIILKDVKFAELRAMMDYMYRGEVNISQDQLAALLKAAESLQIKGLSDNKPSRPPSRPTQGTAHPPSIPSPTPQTRDSSIDSREGSISPTRRRKKARRMSTEASVPPAMPIPIPIIPVPLPTNDSIQGNGEDTVLKEESQRDGVEDLTIDEDAEDNPAVTHNDVVRNFQWHMERSQDEIMNSSDSIRDSQGELSTAGRLVTRSIKFMDEDELPKATTFAILKNVSSPNRRVVEEMKENKLDPAKDVPKLQPLKLTAPKQPSPKLPAPKVAASKLAAAKGPKIPPPKLTPKPSQADAGPRYNIFHRSDRACPPSQKIKGHKCPNCSRCYTARKNLVRHISLECGRDPQYKCPHCSYSKHRRNELKKHIEKKHPNCTPTDPIQIVRDPGPAKPEPKTKTK